MHTSSTMPIGVLARQTDCTVPTIRYYEEIGLLPVAARTGSGQRMYGAEAVKRLTFVRRCRDLGFSVDAVRDLIGLVGQSDRPCVDVRDLASIHLRQVRQKQQELLELENSLTNLVETCDSVCARGTTETCKMVDALAVPIDLPLASVASGACCSG